ERGGRRTAVGVVVRGRARTECIGIGLAEVSRIEEIVRIPSIDRERSRALNVWPVGKAVEAAEVDGRIGVYRERVACSDVGDTRKGPPTQHLLRDSMGSAQEVPAVAH